MACLWLCAALLFSGCAQQAESRSIIMAAPPQDNTNTATNTAPDPTVEDSPIALMTVAPALSGAYSGNENGCYTLATYKDGSADILYFDYAAATMTMLDQPEKPDESFQGRQRNLPLGASLVSHGDGLYLFRMGGSAESEAAHGEAGRAAITRLDAQGTPGRTLIMPSGWSFVLSSAVLSDDEQLYFLAEDTADGTTLLAKANLALDGEATLLHRYEAGSDYSLEGYWEKGLLVMQASALPPFDDPDFNTFWENREYRLLAQGMNSGMLEEIKSWKQGSPACVQGNILYHWNPEDTGLYALNADSREEVLVASNFAPADYVQAQLMRNLLDDKLRIQFSTNRATRDFFVDPATGEVKETPLSKLGDNVAVCAEGAQGILVRTGEHWVAAAKVPDFVAGAQPSPTNPNWVSMPQYALIRPQDYWNGNRKFIEIKDLVYN